MLLCTGCGVTMQIIIGIGFSRIISALQSIAGSIRIKWEDLYQETWDTVTFKWEVWYDVLSTTIWAKNSTKIENLNTNWENLN